MKFLKQFSDYCMYKFTSRLTSFCQCSKDILEQLLRGDFCQGLEALQLHTLVSVQEAIPQNMSSFYQELQLGLAKQPSSSTFLCNETSSSSVGSAIQGAVMAPRDEWLALDSHCMIGLVCRTQLSVVGG